MARVQISTQAWGWVTDDDGNPLSGETVEIDNTDATPATHWSALTGGSSATTALSTNANGTIPRYIEEGSYDVTVNGETHRVEAVNGGGTHSLLVIDTPDDGAEHAFEVFTDNPFSGRKPRFAIENNQDTAPVDAWFHDTVLAIGHWDDAESADASLALYQPASPGTTNLLQVFKPGSQTQKVTYIGPNGGIFMAVTGLSSLAASIYAHGEANNRWQISETGKQQWGPGGSTAVDAALERSATGTLKVTGNLHIDGDISMVKFAGNLGFFNATPVGKQTVTGSRGGNAALASLLTALAAYGIVADSSTA